MHFAALVNASRMLFLATLLFVVKWGNFYVAVCTKKESIGLNKKFSQIRIRQYSLCEYGHL